MSALPPSSFDRDIDSQGAAWQIRGQSAPSYSTAASRGDRAPYGAGTPVNWPQNPGTNSLAVISLVTGILCFAIIPVVLGHAALMQIKRSGEGGSSLAIIGLVLGYLQIIAYVVLFGVLGVSVFWAVNS
ncbi:DUF4190 domain-containing protein [Actinomycetaceae bacterium L2_0104]